MFNDSTDLFHMYSDSLNHTCNDYLPENTPAVLVNNLCKLVLNDTDPHSQIFYHLCCREPIDVKYKDNDLKEFFKESCYRSSNISADLRAELCSYLQPHATEEAFPVNLVTYIILALLTPIGVLANLLIIFTVLKCKKLKNTTGYFISNLAVADLLCIVGMVCYMLTQAGIDMNQNRPALLIFSSIDISIGSASLLHVTAASVERAIAVAKPMVYPLILCRGRAKKVITVIWIYCLLLFIASCGRVFVNGTYHKVIFYFAVTCSFFIPCIIVLVSYLNISIKALKNLQMEKRIERSMIAVNILQNSDRKTSRTHSQLRELKLALNLTVMTVPFVFGWGYFMICNIYETVTGATLTGLQNWFFNMIPYLISCLNPITYLLFTKTLRKESLKILSKPFSLIKARRFSTNSISLSHSRSQRNSDSSEARML